MDALQFEKRGYLREDFRLFHLDSALTEDAAFHYHEFHKLVFFLSGKGSYLVEGRAYALKPYDVVLVRQGAIHKAEISRDERYERVILYIAPDFLRRESTTHTDLARCFDDAARHKSFVLRPDYAQRGALLQTLIEMERAMDDHGFGQDVTARLCLLRLLIALGQGEGADRYRFAAAEDAHDKTAELLEYLNTHLTEPVYIDRLAERFYLSKYYMMRMFRENTGFTIHGYLTDKRLHLAREQMRGGMSASEACFACGYQDYSAFARAYKKRFGYPPSRQTEADP